MGINYTDLDKWFMKEEVDSCDIKCGEMVSKRLSFWLFRRGVKHCLEYGRFIDVVNGFVFWHWWIVLDNGKYIDFGLKYVLGEDRVDLPEGVFDRIDFCGVVMYDKKGSMDCWPYEDDGMGGRFVLSDLFV